MSDFQKITSRDNAKLKLARKVRDGDEQGLICIEGARLASEALRSGIRISSAFLSGEFIERSTNIVDELSDANIETYELSSAFFSSLADTKNAQGITLIGERPASSFSAIEKNLRIETNKIPVVVYLSEVNNPSNLGAVVRTAEASGAAGVLVSPGSADAFSPKALRAAMGSAFRLPIWENADFDEVLKWAESKGLDTIAADLNGGIAYTSIDWKRPSLLLFGSEAHGLSDTSRSRIGKLTLIPMEKSVESLNLAVSCGIILFEARRQNDLQ